jgi:DNA-binding LacI/PurR family transcriptional regulator
MFDRMLGFLQAVEANEVDGVRLEPDEPDLESAYALLAEYLATRTGRRKRPDAVFAATDRLAVAALAVLHDTHVRVPHDVAVIGFDDIPLAALLRPALSSVAQPADALGKVAVEMALNVAAGRTVAPTELVARLVLRESSEPT